MSMIGYEVGRRYADYVRMPEGAYLSLDGSGVLLTVLFDRPTAKECSSFDARNPIQIRVLRKYNLLVLLARFGSSPWMDSTYTPHIGNTPELPPVPDGAGYAMTIRLFDTITGELKKQRIVGLGTDISREIRRIVLELQETQFSNQSYQDQLDFLYSEYSTLDLVNEASVQWSN